MEVFELGFLGDLGKELGKAALKGAVEGLQKSMDQRNAQQRQADSMQFAANEQALQQAGESGDLGAIEELASSYFLQMDYSRADYWARKGARVNDSSCMWLLGEIAFAQGNFFEADQWFSRNISVNADVDSASELGFLYLNIQDNPNQPKDIEKAANLFQFALRQNNSHPEASYGLAVCMLQYENFDESLLKQLLQNATWSENAAIKDDARQFLQTMADNERAATTNNQQNNGGGCFITTAVCGSFGKADDCYELTAFRNFRDGWLVNQADGKNLIAEYYELAPKIVEKINSLADSAEVYKNIWRDYLSACLKFIEKGENLQCKKIYIDMVDTLKKNFLK